MRAEKLDTTFSVRRGGWRPVILGLISEGLSNEEIKRVLLEDYDAEISRDVLNSYIDSLGGKTALAEVARRRDALDLQRVAAANLAARLEKYEEAEGAGSLDHMKFYDKSGLDWLDKLAKIGGHYKEMPVLAVQNNFNVLERVMGVLTKHPELADEVIETIKKGNDVPTQE